MCVHVTPKEGKLYTTMYIKPVIILFTKKKYIFLFAGE